MKFNKLITIIFLPAIAVILSACDKESPPPADHGYSSGVFIACEGTFNANNGSISWYDTDSALIVNNLFEIVNGRPAGDVIMSFTTAGDFGVIVANNSGKLEIVDLKTFESARTITGFSYPRHFVWSGNGTGYLSNGSFDGVVYKINIESGKVTDSIEVGMGPEQLLISGNYLYVANSGGWSYDNTVSVIDTRTNTVARAITVGDGPVAMVAGKDDNVWVLCRGKVVFNESWTEIIEETDSRLVMINSGTGEVEREIIIGQTGDYFNPSWLSADPSGNILYYGENGGVYSIGTDETLQPSEPLIAKQFSAAGVCRETGHIFALEITDYTSAGRLYIYDGQTQLAAMETGIAPRALVFSGSR
jgi:YVTN family beta-propeller protein